MSSLIFKVKIVYDQRDFNKVKKGDIIVARMTSTDCLPIMILAAAFVTDEGGITSHPAIVAREMGKPCLVGTKLATTIFKDGDWIEVNANKGVAQKIN